MDNVLGYIWKKTDWLCRLVADKVLGIFGIKISDERWKSFMQFVKFGIVGLSNTFISYAVYVVAVFLGAYYMVGNVLGFIVSVLNSFYWNNKYVFKQKDGMKRSWVGALIKTFISYGFTGLILSSALLYLWIDVLHVSEYIAPIINLLVTIPLNFLLNKLWAFKQH